MPEGADCPQPYWMCNPGMGALETGGARHAHDDLSGQAWLIIRLPAPTACDAHDQDAACVSPTNKESTTLPKAPNCQQRKSCNMKGTFHDAHNHRSACAAG